MNDDRKPRWRSLTETEREQQYSPSSMLDGPLDPYLVEYAERSAAAYQRVAETGRLVTVEYGPLPANTIDVALPVPADGPVPIHVFIHGGYWQQLSKRESFFLAPACLARGEAFAAVDYTLAPHATLDEIVDECVAALNSIGDNASALGVDADAITVSGSSAGGHLTAMTALKLAPERRPAAVVCVSGIFELEPLIGTSINDAVGLDVAGAIAHSPLLADPEALAGFPPAVVAYGDNETEEFKRQSRSLVDALTAVGRPVVEVEVEGRNHFDVVFDIVPSLTDDLPQPSGR